ncbi:MAG: caspase family protein [Acidimicrobiia bacterium]|nr:caspase family protein [Acidimicrobiia bacterium]MDH3398558.1 caspase family protein [Acidimicrobiia bacterium]
MKKKALCVGINDYPIAGSDLRGCVNDATGWAALLADHYDFTDVEVITDAKATKKNILSGIERLLAGARYGDVLVFTNSSHGSQVPDTSGDEETYDEVLCPYDASDRVITDDELRERFADPGRGVKLTVISDSCHSGTVTRAALADNFPGLATPDDRRVRFLNPALIRSTRLLADPIGAPPRRRVFSQATMKHVLLSGCLDSEYSYDALIEGAYHGAMTYHALEAIRRARYRITYEQLVARVNSLLVKAGYPQHPQLEGRNYAKKRQVFT